MANGRGRRSVPRTAMGTFGGKRTGGSSSKRGGSGLSGFRSTRNTPRPSWGAVGRTATRKGGGGFPGIPQLLPSQWGVGRKKKK